MPLRQLIYGWNASGRIKTGPNQYSGFATGAMRAVAVNEIGMDCSSHASVGLSAYFQLGKEILVPERIIRL